MKQSNIEIVDLVVEKVKTKPESYKANLSFKLDDTVYSYTPVDGRVLYVDSKDEAIGVLLSRFASYEGVFSCGLVRMTNPEVEISQKVILKIVDMVRSRRDEFSESASPDMYSTIRMSLVGMRSLVVPGTDGSKREVLLTVEGGAKGEKMERWILRVLIKEGKSKEETGNAISWKVSRGLFTTSPDMSGRVKSLTKKLVPVLIRAGKLPDLGESVSDSIAVVGMDNSDRITEVHFKRGEENFTISIGRSLPFLRREVEESGVIRGIYVIGVTRTVGGKRKNFSPEERDSTIKEGLKKYVEWGFKNGTFTHKSEVTLASEKLMYAGMDNTDTDTTIYVKGGGRTFKIVVGKSLKYLKKLGKEGISKDLVKEVSEVEGSDEKKVVSSERDLIITQGLEVLKNREI